MYLKGAERELMVLQIFQMCHALKSKAKYSREEISKQNHTTTSFDDSDFDEYEEVTKIAPKPTGRGKYFVFLLNTRNTNFS